MATTPSANPENEAIWREALTKRHKHPMAILPGAPRCVGCLIPFGGLGGPVTKVMGRRPSRKNPNFCNLCDELLPSGGAEVDIAVLFADVRGSTGIAERLGPNAFAALLNRFYKAATDVLVPYNAIIDKMIGDEVMAFFIPARGPDYRRVAVTAACDLIEVVGFNKKKEPWLPLGVGVNAGPAFAGRVGTSEVHDFTVLGDTVNTAARLQAVAKAGEVVLSEDIYQEVANLHPDAEKRVVSLRGKEGPVTVRVIR